MAGDSTQHLLENNPRHKFPEAMKVQLGICHVITCKKIKSGKLDVARRQGAADLTSGCAEITDGK